MTYSPVKKDVAVYAIKMLLNSRRGLRSTTITSQEKSEGYYALTVTGIYWDGTETVISLDEWPIISTEELAGLYHHLVQPDEERKENND